jgi:hypothetical protein
MSASRQRTGFKARPRVALIGVAAILLQALLFGWHHHGLRIALSSESVASVYNDLQKIPAAVTEDSCEICAVLHHQSSSPLAFAMLLASPAMGSAIGLPARVFLDWADARGFHARAPPRV